MIIEDFGIMDRQCADTKAITRLLVNGKIDGRGSRIVKLPGYEDYITSLDILGGGSLTLSTNAVFFKDSNHDYATSPTVFVVYQNNLYYWDNDQSAWVAVAWNGFITPDFTPNSDVRFWFDRGKLHIAAGINGVPALYQYINREKTIDGRGFFNNNVEYVGFWLSQEELPQFSLRDSSFSIEKHENDETNLSLDYNHHFMGVYNCNGQESIYLMGSFVDKVYSATMGDYDANDFCDMIFMIDSTELDKRVTDIDIYVAKENKSLTYPVGNLVDADMATAEEMSFDWRFYKRISINADTVMLETNGDDGSGVFGNGYAMDVDLTKSPKFAFGNNALNTHFYLAARRNGTATWLVSRIEDVQYHIPDATHCRFVVADAIFGTYDYSVKIVSRWQQTMDNYWTRILFMDEDDLGDSYDTINKLSVVNEYYPQYKFATGQDRRVWRFGSYTDEERKNMILWSEVDKSEVNPNGNLVLLNSYAGEEPKGLETVKGGLLALFERSVHYIRMTGEPVQYDAEEGRFEEGCIASKSVVGIDEVVYWLGMDGVKAFSGSEVVDLTFQTLKDDYISLIASDYAGASSYEDICGGYCANKKFIVWCFPNATLEIGGVAVNGLIYDLQHQCFYFMLSDKDFTHLFSDYSGNLYGVASTGIYKLFSDSPDESNQLIWESGQIMDDIDHLILEKTRIRYKGQITEKVYNDTNTDPTLDDDLGNNASLANVSRQCQLEGENIKIRIESESDTNECEVRRIELRPRNLPK